MHGHKEREAITRVRGRESVELAVYKEGDANTVQVANRVAARVEALTRDWEERGIELVKIYDQSTFISAAVNNVRSAALLGGLIAIIVLYGFLRDARSTTIVGIAIPVSVIGAFLLMYANDLSLNIMSLGGIALAVGMLVDNSIVVLENIVRKKEQGESVLEAAQNGTTEVGSAVVAATLTTIAVFFPMIFIEGIAGELFKDQALTVTFALIFSLVVALTLIPMLSALGAQGRYAGSASSAEPLPERRAQDPHRPFHRNDRQVLSNWVVWLFIENSSSRDSAAIGVIILGILLKILGWVAVGTVVDTDLADSTPVPCRRGRLSATAAPGQPAQSLRGAVVISRRPDVRRRRSR